MADARLRELERRSKAGDVEATTALYHAKVALGQSTTGQHVHLDGGKHHSKAYRVGACGHGWVDTHADGKLTDLLVVTTEPELVTCGICRRTRKFRGLPPVVMGKIHYKAWGAYGKSSCGIYAGSSGLTADRSRVTCIRCKACFL